MYDSKRMLAAALLALTMMPMTMTACGGPECGDTTREEDGVCVPDFNRFECAEGTVQDGNACVLDTTGCAAGTELQNGVCVPASSLCGDKTTFNAETGTCEAAEECGAGTAANADGQCIPAAEACADGTMLDSATGICVVDSAACGTGTQLDVASNACVLTDTVCGDNTVLANGACTIVADACETGTVFNDATGTCTPEAVCKPGDAISGGLCVTPAEKLFADATVEVPAGKTDPDDGGTPVELTLPAPGSSIIAKGTIEAPYDDDTDPDTPDIQDVDFLTFSGTKGQLVRMTLAPVPGGVPLFATVSLDSDDIDWERTTAIFGYGSARYMVLPEDGTYIIRVQPNLDLAFDPVGSDDADYAIELEAIALPAPALASAGISGEFTDYTDNFYQLDQTNAGELVGLNFDALGNGVESPIVHVFVGDGAGNYTYDSTVDVSGAPAAAVFPAFADDIAVLIGYKTLFGSVGDYDVSVGAPTNLEDLGALPIDDVTSSQTLSLEDESRYFTFTLGADQVLEITQNDSYDTILDVYGPNGLILDDRVVEGRGTLGTSCGSLNTCSAYIYSPNGGSYVVEARDLELFDPLDFEFSFRSSTPGGPETLAVPNTVTVTSPTELLEGLREYTRFDVTTDSLLTIDATPDSDGTTDLFIFDAATGEEVYAGDEVIDSVFGGDVAGVEVPLMAGNYLIGVGAEYNGDLDTGYELVVTANTPPVFEVEPNDDAGTATPADFANQFALGSIDSTSPDFFTFQVPADLGANEAWALSIRPDAAFNTTDTYTYRVSDSTGVVAEQVDVSTDGLLWLTGLTAAETYTLEISASSATAVDYRVEAEAVTGLVESEPNNDLMTNATNLGSFTSGTPIVAYGALSTDGLTSDVDAHQITLATTLAGETFTLTFEDLWNGGSNATVDVAVFASGDLVNPVATATGFGGTLSFPNLAADTYTLLLTRTDTDVVTSARYRVTADSIPGIVLSSSPNAPILDNTVPGTSDTITMPTACTLTSIEVDVDISHGWRGDMLVTLTSPTGTVVTLHDGTGGSADDIIGTYGGAGMLTPAESLDGFLNEDALGDWTFYAEDNALFIAGNLNSWGLKFGCQ